MRKRYTEEQRAELVRLVADEGMSTRRAAARVKVPDSTAYHWVQRAEHSRGRRKTNSIEAPGATEAQGAPTFVRLVRAETQRAAVYVRVGAAMLEVREGFNAELLRQVVAALTEGPP
jgi:transposase-like protein